ncbi:hypothetical protein KZ813_18630 [Sphingomonas sp. RHCKR7]|uniref:hypothetical protein n=1 Tax=Sphingomonas folli TaxID=2862497 RepID=UPI001CA556C6|nr:hypothetical protein [Sphingomonas folli]MBW6528860.1 hypothetical protein [Sphingomonas folli]
MSRAGTLLLAATLAVAGCSRPAADQAPANDTAAVTEPSGPNLAGGSWDGVFTDPGVALDRFGRIGLRPGAYEKRGSVWRSEAAPTPMSDPQGKHPVMAYFTASGAADRLDRIEYRLAEPTAANDQLARDSFDKWVAQSLQQLGVAGGESAVAAIHGTKRAAGQLKGGADYAVTRTTTPKERLLAVTFTRSAPTSGQTNQGKM